MYKFSINVVIAFFLQLIVVLACLHFKANLFVTLICVGQFFTIINAFLLMF